MPTSIRMRTSKSQYHSILILLARYVLICLVFHRRGAERINESWAPQEASNRCKKPPKCSPVTIIARTWLLPYVPQVAAGAKDFKLRQLWMMWKWMRNLYACSWMFLCTIPCLKGCCARWTSFESGSSINAPYLKGRTTQQFCSRIPFQKVDEVWDQVTVPHKVQKEFQNTRCKGDTVMFLSRRRSCCHTTRIARSTVDSDAKKKP